MLKDKISLLKKATGRFIEGNKNLLLLAVKKPLKPKWIWFEVTDKCNSRCSHCHIWQKTPTADPLTLAELEKIFSDPLLKDVESVINSGGEAILREDMAEILKLEHRLFPKAILDLSTNAVWPERSIEIIKEVLPTGAKLNIGVSMDAVGEKHDKIRGIPGNWQKADYLLRELLVLKEKYPEQLSLVIGQTLSPLTVDEYPAVKKYGDTLGIDAMPQWFNQSSFYDNSAVNMKEETEKMIATVESQPISAVRERWLKLLKNKKIKFHCFAAQTFFVLKCDGRVVPCLSLWDENFGNAREKSLTEIWSSPEIKKARRLAGKCPGCLNSWGVNWSLSTIFYPRLAFHLRNPKSIIERFKKK